jgi:acyl carrier protein
MTETIERLRALSFAERRDALEEMIVAEFKATLLMDDDEDLPLTESYFDLGFTSLRINEIKDRLEVAFGRPINTNQLFNSPTVAHLLDHLTGDVLADLFAENDVEPAQDNSDEDLWDEFMRDLHQA